MPRRWDFSSEVVVVVVVVSFVFLPEKKNQRFFFAFDERGLKKVPKNRGLLPAKKTNKKKSGASLSCSTPASRALFTAGFSPPAHE